MQQIDKFEGNRDSGKERGRKCKPNLTIASYNDYDDRDSARGRGYGRRKDKRLQIPAVWFSGMLNLNIIILSSIIPTVLPPDVYRIGTFFLPFSNLNVLYHVLLST